MGGGLPGLPRGRLPGLSAAVDRRDDPGATVGMALAAGFVAVHVAVLTAVLVAVPAPSYNVFYDKEVEI